jgi:tRNA wybutosine-synthesizing protein 2
MATLGKAEGSRPLQKQPYKKRDPPPTPFAILSKTTSDFLNAHPPQTGPSQILLSSLPKRWSSYPPMILFPPSALSSPEWKSYLSSLPPDLLAVFYAHIAKSLKATHLARNAPIHSNPIRSPQITPLHGNFGTYTPNPPTEQDFPSAFWATAVQNGIKQTWAPLYTMFSRGNITEKTRVFQFPQVKGEIVADLFVGIGYFAFSYLKAGARRVWGWDLNPWSVEGIRRGAEMNGWTCVVNSMEVGDEQIVVFNGDNQMAVKVLGEKGVKVKHVNLGLLPSSECAWKIACEILDEEGGYIHVHGNCRDIEIEEWSRDTVKEFEGLFGQDWQVRIFDKFRVKEFGPGVGHWVLDLYCKKR